MIYSTVWHEPNVIAAIKTADLQDLSNKNTSLLPKHKFCRDASRLHRTVQIPWLAEPHDLPPRRCTSCLPLLLGLFSSFRPPDFRAALSGPLPVTTRLPTRLAVSLASDLPCLLLGSQRHQIPGNLLGIGRRPEDLTRVLLQGFDPAPDIGRMLARIMADPQLVRDHQRGNLGPQLLPRIGFRSERRAKIRPVQPRGVPCGVPLMPISA